MLDHSALAALCGIDRAEYGGVEPEYPELALALDCGAGRIDAAQLTQLAAPLGAATGWQGQPSKLGPRPLQYWRQAEAMMAAFERSAPIELAAAPSAPVITSYSIHYTKLYDRAVRHPTTSTSVRY